MAKRESKGQKIARRRKERRTQLGSFGKALVKAGVDVAKKDLDKAFPTEADAKSKIERDLKRKARSPRSR